MKRSLQKTSLFLSATALSALMVVLPACSKKEQPAPQPPANTVAPAQPVQQNKPVQRPISAASKPVGPPVAQFDFSNKKDPFKPYVMPKPVVPAGGVAKIKAALPIHNFDVSQFKLIGIITGGKVNQAMVTDPSGKGYVLKAGMTIGKNEGRITAITNSGVEVVEQFRDDNGRVRKEYIKITLPRKQ